MAEIDEKVYPNLETPYITPKFPLEIVNGSYVQYSSKDIIKVISQNIKCILLTNPGERLGDANFGAGLRRFLFDFPQTIDGAIQTTITEQIREYASYITLLELNLEFYQESLKIQMQITIDEINAKANFMIDLDVENYVDKYNVDYDKVQDAIKELM